MPTRRFLPAAVVCLALIGGCSTLQQQSPAQIEQQRQLPRVVELEAVPFFPQTEYQCGPAALATVLQAQGIEVSPETLSPHVYLPGRKGSLQIEMIAAARRHLVMPYVLENSFTALLTEVAAGNPVLVLQNLGLDWLPRWHYAVVVGYNLDANILVLRSGTLKQRITPFAVFKRTWQRARNWALVVVPVGKIPATANVTAYLKAALGFEETGLTDAALNAYRSATEHWPEQAETWLMSGNMAFAGGRLGDAVSDFRRAARLAPSDIRIWNNLAYTLREQGCPVQAKAALQCALQIAPKNSNLLHSMQDIEQGASVPADESCEEILCTFVDH